LYTAILLAGCPEGVCAAGDTCACNGAGNDCTMECSGTGTCTLSDCDSGCDLECTDITMECNEE